MKPAVLRCCCLLAVLLVVVSAPATLLAQTPPPAATASSPTPILRKLSTTNWLNWISGLPAAQSSADNSWMMVSAALVLMMTGPGLALFYGGLVRSKNMLAIMMQSFTLMAVISVLWALVGYSLAFGGERAGDREFQFAMLRGVGEEPNPDYAGTIPQLTFMVYQLMFAIITPALITGATAERMKFCGTMLFLTLWFLSLRADGSHGLGQGRIPERLTGRKISDAWILRVGRSFTSVRACPRWCALYIWESASGFPKQPMPPHSLILSFMGACLLWVGWFGFNAGSALASNGLATSAFIATHLRGGGGD